MKNLKIDFNLLKIMFMLFEERSVTRAAERLFVTPSAVSKSLANLRIKYNDPLFIRCHKGLILTPYAEELEPYIKQTIIDIDKCFTHELFDPMTYEGSVSIAAPEQFSVSFISKLTLKLSKLAPNLIIDAQHLNDNYQVMLADGDLDFAVYMEQPYPSAFISKNVYSAEPIYWFRKKHPLGKIKRQIQLSDVLSYPHVAFKSQNVSKHDARVFLEKFSENGHTIKYSLHTSHLLVGLDLLLKTDAVMFTPSSIGLPSIFHQKLQWISVKHIPPFDSYGLILSLIQHKRTSSSHRHRWLANRIDEVFKEL